MPRATKRAAKTVKSAVSRAKKTATKKAAAGKKTATAAQIRKAQPAKAPATKAQSTKAQSTKAQSTKAATKKATTTKQAANSKAAAKAPAKAAGKTTKQPAKRAGGAAADKFFEGQRKALLEERETYARQAQALKAEADALAEDMEPGDVQFDEESGEGDTINVERERDLALSAQALASVEEIDRALAKIDDGSYGICEQCGEPIPKERLKALPYAALCVRCKSQGLSTRR